MKKKIDYNDESDKDEDYDHEKLNVERGVGSDNKQESVWLQSLIRPEPASKVFVSIQLL